MDELDYALETVDGTDFEKLAGAFLRTRGYEVKESGVHGRDGGWDARIRIDDRTGIAHASVQDDWRPKLRKDAEKVAELEDDRDEDYELFVFVTNQEATGQQELDMEDEITEEYGWKLQLFHRENLLGSIYNEHPELADRYLGVDLSVDTDHLAELKELRDERIEVIHRRDGDAEELVDGPMMVLHIIPNGISSNQPVRPATEIPNPWVLGGLGVSRGQSSGKARYAWDRDRRSLTDTDARPGYAVLRNNGLYESVTTKLFHSTVEGEVWVKTELDRRGPEMGTSVLITVRETLAALDEMGYVGSAFVWVTVLDAEDTMLQDGMNLYHQVGDHPVFGVDRYTTEYVTVPIGEHVHEVVIREMEPVLSELWLQFGHSEGYSKIEEGEWVDPPVRLGNYTFPDS